MEVITLEQLRSTDIDSVIQGCKKQINEYQKAFKNASDLAKENGDDQEYSVFCLFDALSSMHLRPENKSELKRITNQGHI